MVEDEETRILSKENPKNSETKTEDFALLPAIKDIINIAFPNAIYWSLQVVLQTINMFFLKSKFTGDQRTNAIDALGICHIYYNCFLRSLAMGIVVVFETLGSNAIGARKFRLLGLYFQKIQFLAYSLAILSLIIHFFIFDKLIGLLKLDAEVMSPVREYMSIFIFSILFEVQSDLNFVYINVIGKSYFNLISIIVPTILHTFWCFLILKIFGLGIQSLAFVMIFTQFTIMSIGSSYIYILKPLKESIFFFSKETFQELGQILKMSASSCLMLFFEWCGMEVLVIVAILISKVDYSAYVILINLFQILLYCGYGFQIATVFIVARELGKGNSRNTKNWSLTIAVMGFSINFILILFCLLFRFQIAEFYSSDPKIIERITRSLLFFGIAVHSFYFMSILNSICRGLGEYLLPCIFTFLGCYVAILGAAYLFGKFLNIGVGGIFLGIFVGNALQILGYILFMCTLELEAIKNQRVKEMEKDESNYLDLDSTRATSDTFSTETNKLF